MAVNNSSLVSFFMLGQTVLNSSRHKALVPRRWSGGKKKSKTNPAHMVPSCAKCVQIPTVAWSGYGRKYLKCAGACPCKVWSIPTGMVMMQRAVGVVNLSQHAR